MNKTLTAEGWRTLDGQVLYHHAQAGGVMYQAVLRRELTARLGVDWGRVENGMAEVKGLDRRDLIMHFSTRRREATALAEEWRKVSGLDASEGPTAAEMQTAVLATRQSKNRRHDVAKAAAGMRDYEVSDLALGWVEQAADAPVDVVGAVAHAVGAVAEPRPGEVDDDMFDRVAARLAERFTSFTVRDVIMEVAPGFRHGATVGELGEAAHRWMVEAERRGLVVRLVDRGSVPEEAALEAGDYPGLRRRRGVAGDVRWTTTEVLRAEMTVLDGSDEDGPVVGGDHVDEAIAAAALPLVAEQAAMVRRVCSVPRRVVAVVGPGGAGKTTAVGAVVRAAVADGRQVVGLATAAHAAQQLEGAVGRSCYTIARCRHMVDRERASFPDALAFGRGSVIVVDEASMVSTRDLAWIIREASAADAKVVLVGDPTQLPSVDAGGMFARLVSRGGDAVSEDLAAVNMRQRLDVDREAVRLLREGAGVGALDRYDRSGRLTLADSQIAGQVELVRRWAVDVGRTGPAESVMLAATNTAVDDLNRLGRLAMADAGRLHGHSVTYRTGLVLQAGDRIQLRQNDYIHGDLRNRQTGTVEAVDTVSGMVMFRRDADDEVVRLERRYVERSVDYAYARTTHGSQGATVTTAHVWVDASLSREHGYVDATRARLETYWYARRDEAVLEHGGGWMATADDMVVRIGEQLSEAGADSSAGDAGMVDPTYWTTEELAERLADIRRIALMCPPTVDPVVRADCEDRLVGARQAAAANPQDPMLAGRLATVSRELADIEAAAARRTDWLRQHIGDLAEYGPLIVEAESRLDNVAAAVILQPPDRLVAIIGERPVTPEARARWDRLAHSWAEASIVGDDPIRVVSDQARLTSRTPLVASP